MARFKDTNYCQTKMLPVWFKQQILPGTFEYSLTYLIDHELDLSIFHPRYPKDDNGRRTDDPGILLKLVLLAYSRGITSSRKIEHLCRENILFMAISGDSQPHFTTLAQFISGCSEEIAGLFLQVLMVCDAEGLIGKELFAIDGCKLPGGALMVKKLMQPVDGSISIDLGGSSAGAVAREDIPWLVSGVSPFVPG